MTIINETAVVHSEKASMGGARLVEKLSKGNLVIERYPNCATEYTGDEEVKDYISFSKFLPSTNGQFVLDLLGDE